MSNIIIVFDTETTGFSPEKNEIVQLSYILYDVDRQSVLYATKLNDDIVKINGKIPKNTSDVHGITKDITLDKQPIKEHIDKFIQYCDQANKFVGHNIQFDIKMITGQIKKVMNENPDTVERYTNFLNRFEMVGSDLPEVAYCTMEESKGICAEMKGTKKRKAEKLMEVHRLLFNQDVKGQLHNALVDISVTLRVYLKLTADLDICSSMDRTATPSSVNNNNEICNLINPVDSVEPVEDVDYSGELITAIKVIPDGIEEEKIMVQSIAKKFVSDVEKQAIANVMSKMAPTQHICSSTSISICRTIIKSGVKKGQECRRPVTINNEFCGYHKPKDVKINSAEDEIVNQEVLYKPTPDTQMPVEVKYSDSILSKLTKPFTRKKKVHPIGGRKNKTKRRRNKSRKVKKYRKGT